MFMSKDKNLRFFIWKHKGVNVLSFMYSNYLYSPNWKSVFCRTLWKGFGNTQEEKMFLSLCNVECIYFWWFSKHRWYLLFLYSSVKPRSGFNWCLIPSGVLGIILGALERTHCWKSVDVVVVKHYDLLGKIRELYVTSGFSSETHNSCRLICLRFNPVKMSKWRRHFHILQCVGRIY